VNKPKNELTKPRLRRFPDCSEVRISEFRLVNGSRELVNYQFELGPDRSSPTWVTWRWQLTARVVRRQKFHCYTTPRFSVYF